MLIRNRCPWVYNACKKNILQQGVYISICVYKTGHERNGPLEKRFVTKNVKVGENK